MAKFDPEKFDAFVLAHEIVGFHEEGFVLACGRRSHWYANWRNLTRDVASFSTLADFVLDFAYDHKLSPTFFYGVPEGASPLGLITQYKYIMERGGSAHGFPLIMGRKSPKGHGSPQDRFFIGNPHGNCVVLEDVTTTGDSLLAEVKRFVDIPQVTLLGTISLLGRMERRSDTLSVKEALKERGVAHYSLTTAERILPLAYRQSHTREVIGRTIEEEYREHGVIPLRLLNP